MRELVDTHTHTELCGHATGSVFDLVEAACARGVSTLGITEHYPLSPVFDPNGDSAMPASELSPYLESIERARLEHPGIEILAGCEFDWLGEADDRSIQAADLERFELVCASIHFIGTWPIDHPELSMERWGMRDQVDGIWRDYFARWCEAAACTRFPFHVMCHPDLVKKFGIYPSFRMGALYDDAVDAVLASDRMIEVNASGAFCPCGEVYPAPDLLRRFASAGVPCTVGSDAHCPENVARGIFGAMRSMYQAGYRTVTVPTRDGDRREVELA